MDGYYILAARRELYWTARSRVRSARQLPPYLRGPVLEDARRLRDYARRMHAIYTEVFGHERHATGV